MTAMRTTPLILTVLLASVAGTGCVVRGHAGFHTTAYAEPSMVVVSPGVYVIERGEMEDLIDGLPSGNPSERQRLLRRGKLAARCRFRSSRHQFAAFGLTHCDHFADARAEDYDDEDG